jgi:hypothetical protein
VGFGSRLDNFFFDLREHITQKISRPNIQRIYC